LFRYVARNNMSLEPLAMHREDLNRKVTFLLLLVASTTWHQLHLLVCEVKKQRYQHNHCPDTTLRVGVGEGDWGREEEKDIRKLSI